MSEGVNVNWGLLKQPDYVGDYANAFQVGQQLAQQGGVQAAGQQSATDAAGATNAFSPFSPAVTPSLQQYQTQQYPDRPAGGLVDLQGHIDAMDPQQKAVAAQQAEKIAGVLKGIQVSTAAPDERLGIARHIAPAAGIDPARITIDDVTDQGIARHMAQAMSLKAQLEQSHIPPRLDLPRGGAANLSDFELHREFADQ